MAIWSDHQGWTTDRRLAPCPGCSAIDQMFFIPAYPFWSLMIIAVDVVALYGLCAYGSRSNLEAA